MEIFTQRFQSKTLLKATMRSFFMEKLAFNISKLASSVIPKPTKSNLFVLMYISFLSWGEIIVLLMLRFHVFFWFFGKLKDFLASVTGIVWYLMELFLMLTQFIFNFFIWIINNIWKIFPLNYWEFAQMVLFLAQETLFCLFLCVCNLCPSMVTFFLQRFSGF